MYRSKLEQQVAKKLPNASYEPFALDYTVAHKYTPDFVEGNNYYEVKGFFRAGDQQKYLAIADMMRQTGRKFIFILSHPDKPVRKGAKLTMSKWCDRHGIKWTAV